MVIPIYDGNPFAFKSPPYVSWGLIVANLLIFVWLLSVDASSNSQPKLFHARENGWSGREDLNLRPPGPEPGALPG